MMEEGPMVQDISKSIEACAAHYGSDADAMREYLINGQNEAFQIDNRGPPADQLFKQRYD